MHGTIPDIKRKKAAHFNRDEEVESSVWTQRNNARMCFISGEGFIHVPYPPW